MAAKFNRGDVSEGILAAAITARFVSKTTDVTDQDVINTIRKIKQNRPRKSSSGLTTTTNLVSENYNPRVKDTVVCLVNLAEVNMKAFLNLNTYRRSDIKGLVSAARKFANGRYIKEWADMMYNNNQKNKIEVLSQGLLDQSGTKVDLKVVIDGKQAGVGVSLKAGDVKQFGQVGGTRWAAMKELFQPLGVKMTSNLEKDYIDLIAQKRLAPALTLIYREATDQINRMDSEKFAKSLADFMDYHATRGERNVVLVRTTRADARVYNFSNLKKGLKGSDVKVKLTSGTTSKLQGGGYKGGSKIPKMVFLIDDNVLVSIRVKMEGNRLNPQGKRLPLTVRSLVEKGPVTEKLTKEQE